MKYKSLAELFLTKAQRFGEKTLVRYLKRPHNELFKITIYFGGLVVEWSKALLIHHWAFPRPSVQPQIPAKKFCLKNLSSEWLLL